MKYKVLLVDDERIYLEYMLTMMDWESCGCQVCGCAENGEDALRLVETENPDIIFMDINMSKMDGLEACDRLRQQNSHAKIIIMTAYDKFSFAHKAIKLKVDDYLLKPFDQMELEAALGRCIAEISEEHAVEKELKEVLLMRALNRGAGSGEELTKDKKDYLAVLIQKADDMSRDPADVFFEKYFRPLQVESVYLKNYQNCGVIVHIMEENLVTVNLIRQKYLAMIKEDSGSRIGWVALGNIVHGLEGLQESYKNALLASQNRVKMHGIVVAFEDLQKLDKTVSSLSAEDVSDLIEAFEAKDYEDADRILERIFALSSDNMLSFQYVIAIYYSVIAQIHAHYHYHEDRHVMEYEEHSEIFLQEIALCTTGRQMLEIIKNDIYEAYSDCIKIPEGSKKEILTWKIENYIRQHYTETDFSIQKLADSLYYENSYIRRIYKMQTGETVFQRMERLRIEKAKELLLEGKYKNSEIAELVGYGDQQYFSRRFKLYCGCTPSQYKKSKRS